MSLGIFRSIRGSYVPQYRREADKMILRLNAELKARGLPEYHDPDPGERGLRRLPCDHAGARTFSQLQKLAEEAGLSWTIGRLRSERWIALPLEFDGTFSVRLGRVLFFFPRVQLFTSVRTVYEELIALAPVLRIPFTDGSLGETTAERLANGLSLAEDEPAGFLEDERVLWLDLYYAARYCMEDSAPLVIA